MSHTVLELLMELNIRNLEIQLAMQCAPVICGLKASNLLITEKWHMQEVKKLFQNSHLSYYVLMETEKKMVILLYQPVMLRRYLSDRRIQTFFRDIGYEGLEFYEILKRVQIRYQAYKTRQMSFPHEMGLLLGYPLEDVEGFIQYKGKNSLYTGYWKVYSNVASKRKLFDQYEVAKETLLRLLSQGVGMVDLLNYYRKQLQVIAV